MAHEFNREELNYVPPLPELQITDIEALKVLFSERRLEIIKHLIDQPRSVQAVARILQKPVHRLYYHFNRLIDHNLIRLVGTQSHPGAVEEKFYHISAYRLVIDRGLLNFHKESDGETFIRDVLEETRSWLSHDLDSGLVVEVNRNNNSELDTILIERRIATIPKETMREFQRRLMLLLDEFASPDGSEHSEHPHYALTLVLHPTNGHKNVNG